MDPEAAATIISSSGSELAPGASFDPSEKIEFRRQPPHVAVREYRKALGMTQRELAERSRIPQPQISAIENGREALWKTYDRLLDAMGARLLFSVHPWRAKDEIIGDLANARLLREDRLRRARQARPRRAPRQLGFLDLAFDASAR